MSNCLKLLRLCAIYAISLLFTGCSNDTDDAGSTHYPDQKLKAPNRLDKGVVLAWNRESAPVDDKVNSISVGQALVVRVRNLDGWLIDKLKDGRLTGEPAMTPEERLNYFLLQTLRGSDTIDDRASHIWYGGSHLQNQVRFRTHLHCDSFDYPESTGMAELL